MAKTKLKNPRGTPFLQKNVWPNEFEPAETSNRASKNVEKIRKQQKMCIWAETKGVSAWAARLGGWGAVLFDPPQKQLYSRSADQS